MKRIQPIAAIIFAIPLLVFGSNFFFDFIPMMPDDGSSGFDMLMNMREGGMMIYVALAHILIGLMLLFPRTRFLGAILHLPLTLAILFFHLALMPSGLGLALVLLVLNLGALYQPEKFNALVA